MSDTEMNPTELAHQVRNRLWGDTMPVDPVTIARKLGLRVLKADLPEDVSGALVKKQGQDPIILLHEDDSDPRKRFTCAHEIGHYIYRTNQGDSAYDYIDFRNGKSAAGTDREEIFANRFAANLLMPDKDVKRTYKKSGSAALTALRFDVSDDAMTIRLRTLGILHG